MPWIWARQWKRKVLAQSNRTAVDAHYNIGTSANGGRRSAVGTGTVDHVARSLAVATAPINGYGNSVSYE